MGRNKGEDVSGLESELKEKLGKLNEVRFGGYFRYKFSRYKSDLFQCSMITLTISELQETVER